MASPLMSGRLFVDVSFRDMLSPGRDCSGHNGFRSKSWKSMGAFLSHCTYTHLLGSVDVLFVVYDLCPS